MWGGKTDISLAEALVRVAFGAVFLELPALLSIFSSSVSSQVLPDVTWFHFVLLVLFVVVVVLLLLLLLLLLHRLLPHYRWTSLLVYRRRPSHSLHPVGSPWLGPVLERNGGKPCQGPLQALELRHLLPVPRLPRCHFAARAQERSLILTPPALLVPASPLPVLLFAVRVEKAHPPLPSIHHVRGFRGPGGRGRPVRIEALRRISVEAVLAHLYFLLARGLAFPFFPPRRLLPHTSTFSQVALGGAGDRI